MSSRWFEKLQFHFHGVPFRLLAKKVFCLCKCLMCSNFLILSHRLLRYLFSFCSHRTTRRWNFVFSIYLRTNRYTNERERERERTINYELLISSILTNLSYRTTDLSYPPYCWMTTIKQSTIESRYLHFSLSTGRSIVVHAPSDCVRLQSSSEYYCLQVLYFLFFKWWKWLDFTHWHTHHTTLH